MPLCRDAGTHHTSQVFIDGAELRKMLADVLIPDLPKSTYLIHCQSVVLCQGHVHRVRGAGERNGARVLAVLPLTQNLCCLLSFLYVKRTNGDPTKTLKPLHVGFVNSLETEWCHA